MIHIECSTQINRPRDEVFDVLTDVESFPMWQRGVVTSRLLTPGPIRAGSQFEETSRVGPWKLRIVCTVTDFKANQRFAFEARSSGPLDCDASFDLQPVSGGTRVTISGVARLKGFWRLMRPMLGRELRRETEAELVALKRTMEAGSRVPANVTS